VRLGADVIKVEPPTGDAIRNASSQRSDGLSHIFVMSNTDKRGLVLDSASRAGP
jgi:crotonobetainyl-CoA:carnitine CoA-transferase CaiB-like acyl-CoA transferase